MTSGTGICSVTATKAADANYNSATSTAVTVSAALADQAALSVTGVPGVAQAYGTSFIVGTSGGSGTGAVSYDSTGACSVSGNTVTMTSGTGTCSVTATKAADTNYNGTASAAATVAAAPADQAALSVTGVPGVQAYGTSFIVGTSGGSGTGSLSVVASGACSISGNTVTITSGTGTCSVTATKAADTNYNGTASAAATVAAALRPLTIAPASYSRAVGAANPTLGGTVSGALAADLNVSLFVAYNTTATTSSPAGVYPINVTVTGGAADSYAVTISTATLTVVSAGVDLSESALSLPASANAGGQMSVSGTTVNGGDASSPATTTLFYLSTEHRHREGRGDRLSQCAGIGRRRQLGRYLDPDVAGKPEWHLLRVCLLGRQQPGCRNGREQLRSVGCVYRERRRPDGGCGAQGRQHHRCR